MKEITLYHNPRCSKSREAFQLIEKKIGNFTIVEYLKNTPTKKELELLLLKLNIKPFELVRKTEKLFKEKFANKKFNDHEWVQILVENPILIERPIVVKGNKAVIGRPIENIIELLKSK